MSLDVSKLENVREVGNGTVQARCPACAEAGGDRTGEHLRVYADGRFGCCVQPQNREHRRRIFALAGDRRPGKFSVRVAGGKAAVQQARSVKVSLTDVVGTLGTEVLKLRAGVTEGVEAVPVGPVAGKDLEVGVPSVPSAGNREQRTEPWIMADGTLVIPFESDERFHWWKDGQSIAETRAEAAGGVRVTTRKETHGSGV